MRQPVATRVEQLLTERERHLKAGAANTKPDGPQS
jgi:hypothetical protein